MAGDEEELRAKLAERNFDIVRGPIGEDEPEREKEAQEREAQEAEDRARFQIMNAVNPGDSLDFQVSTGDMTEEEAEREQAADAKEAADSDEPLGTRPRWEGSVQPGCEGRLARDQSETRSPGPKPRKHPRTGQVVGQPRQSEPYAPRLTILGDRCS
ncbi:hypothetical protein ACWGKU_17080 [Kitasatospora sp. NPDC054768]